MQSPGPLSQSPVFRAQSLLPTPHGSFDLRVFVDAAGLEHVALSKGEWDPQTPVLMRVHSECLTGDAFGSLRCDCGEQLQAALRQIATAGTGLLLYLRQEGRGIGLANKIRAYALQDQGADTVEANEQLGFAADQRQYDVALEMLRALKVGRVRLLTNNPRKLDALERGGIEIVERVALAGYANPHNAGYLSTKAQKLGHLFDPTDAE
ncbi:MAG: GTP cyclohydrolase II [Oceanococcaceae bacterium]